MDVVTHVGAKCWQRLLCLASHARTPTDKCVSRVLPLETVLPIAINSRKSLESAHLYIFQRFQLKLSLQVALQNDFF